MRRDCRRAIVRRGPLGIPRRRPPVYGRSFNWEWGLRGGGEKNSGEGVLVDDWNLVVRLGEVFGRR